MEGDAAAITRHEVTLTEHSGDFHLHALDRRVDEARRAAVADARARAALLAEAAGVTLGPVTAITEGGGYVNPTPMFRAEASAAPVPVAGGEIGVTSTVTMVFSIAD